MSNSVTRQFPLLVFLLFLTVAVPSASLAGAKEARPNIVFLLSDDQTDAATGCYGNTQVKTPNMDRLGADGIIFNNHYNTTAICMASRVCILTGMYEYKTGCNFMHGDLRYKKFQKSYPLLLRKSGYFTGMAGKIGFTLEGKKFNEFEDHFDVFGGGPGQTKYQTNRNPAIAQYAKKYPHSTRAYAAWADDFFEAAKKSGKPFCMSISFKAPHLPFTPDAAFDDVYRGKTYRKPANYGKKNAPHLAPQVKTGRQFNSYRFWTDSEESYQTAIRGYNQLVHGVDVALGMIRESLKQQGFAENTVIVFTSDNGYSCGAHGFGGKVLPYEEASRSPLIIFDPRQSTKMRGQRRDTVTANIDIAPTILNLAGLTIPKNMDGVSLVPLLRDPAGIQRQSIALTNLWGNSEIQELTVVTKDWKYIYWSYESETMRPTEELFHLAEDRLEMKNLAKDENHTAKLNQMQLLYDRRVQHLQKHAVDFNDYQKYKILFDRHATLKQKAPLFKRAGKGNKKKRRNKRKQKKTAATVEVNFSTFAKSTPPTEIANPGHNGYVSSELIYALDDKPTPQCHASTIVETKNGLVAAWFGGTHEKNKDVGIWVSRHNGKTWSKPVEVANGVQSAELRHPCWNPVLFQPKKGPLMLFYKVGPSPSLWWGMLTTSTDGGKTWSNRRRLGTDKRLGSRNMNLIGPVKNKPIQLADGSILCPSSSEHDGWRAHFEMTTDLGKTWTVIGPINDGKKFGSIQPSILTYKNGAMQILCRTRQNAVGQSWSTDGGKTWSPFTATSLPNPNAGTDAVTLKDGRQLIVYNHTIRNSDFPSGRNMINVAISADGKTWTPVLTLERSKGEFSYPAVIQAADGKIHITYTYLRRTVKHVVLDPLKLQR